MNQKNWSVDQLHVFIADFFNSMFFSVAWTNTCQRCKYKWPYQTRTILTASLTITVSTFFQELSMILFIMLISHWVTNAERASQQLHMFVHVTEKHPSNKNGNKQNHTTDTCLNIFFWFMLKNMSNLWNSQEIYV